MLFWRLFDWSGWAQTATVVVGTTGDGVSFASVLTVGVGSASQCGGGYDR
jgi:hypothetical protein